MLWVLDISSQVSLFLLFVSIKCSRASLVDHKLLGKKLLFWSFFMKPFLVKTVFPVYFLFSFSSSSCLLIHSLSGTLLFSVWNRIFVLESSLNFHSYAISKMVYMRSLTFVPTIMEAHISSNVTRFGSLC